MQFTTLIVAVVALAASAFATPVPDGETLQYCGGQPYYPSQYTCYPDPSPPLLCPITNGVVYQRCDKACYSPAEYGCSNGVLVPLSDCNGQVYDQNSYVCINGQLCPKTAPNVCGIACYSLSRYWCDNGVLKQQGQS